MDLTGCAVLLIVSYLALAVLGQEVNGGVLGQSQSQSAGGLTSTIVQRSHERVLMRRKRFLIFPTGAHVIVSILRRTFPR